MSVFVVVEIVEYQSGEEILPETMWMSSQQGEKEEELGIIHDKGLELNPNIL